MPDGSCRLRRRPLGRRGRVGWLPLLLGLALALGLTVFGGGRLVHSTERQLELADFKMAAVVARDGSVQVRETLTARFHGSWNGIVRQIPLMANRPDGLEPLGIKVLSVTDEKGQPLRTESRPIGNDLELRIFVPGAKDGTRTAVLAYEVRHGIRSYPDHDEFNWNVTGHRWSIPIEHVNASVTLPEEVKGLHASVYSGPAGAQGKDARLTIGPRQVQAETTRRLSPGEGLTLAVGFDQGLVATARSGESSQHRRLALFVPLGIAGVLGGIWWVMGRDPALGSLAVVDEPPGQLPPAVMGCLVKERMGRVELGSSLVDLAVKGHIAIAPLQRPPLLKQAILSQQLLQRLELPSFSTPYRFTLLTSPGEWNLLPPHQRFLLERLFPWAQVGMSVDTEQLRNSFYVHIPGFQQRLRREVQQQGFFQVWPGTVRTLTLVVGGGLVALLVLLGVPPYAIFQAQGSAQLWSSGLCLATTLACIGGFAWIMPRRTARGTEMLRQTLGFHQYLRGRHAPAASSKLLTADRFERFLPYAIEAGLTRQWAGAFRDIVDAPPRWYIHFDDTADNTTDNTIDINADFALDDFGVGLEDFCSSSGNAMNASPGIQWELGDSGSGSSGGGSSGGGDGGGGGGGF